SVGEVCSSKVDLVFVLDSSDSIDKDAENPENWQSILAFAASIIDKYTIGPDDTRVALVTFSYSSEIEFDLNTYTDKQKLKERILATKYVNSYTNTFEGLRMMRVAFSFSRGDRADVPNVAIVVTDGEHTRDTGDPIPEAERAQAEGITILAVGVNQAVEAELAGISSAPHKENETYWMRTDFTDLTNIINELQKTSCA
ncbi:hypothetical protein CAPTEDRAFT_76139, partial [Capitella teleta]